MARIEAVDCSAFSDQEAAEETLLTIVVPCHNEQDTINPFLDECSRVAEQLDAFLGIKVHYIFVDDGSSDATLAVLHHVCAEHSEAAFISFSRNFGKEAALYAGLVQAYASEADLIAVMDADLQDPPALLLKMCGLVQDGICERAAAYRVSRDGEPPIRSWFARRFYALMNKVTDLNLRDGARDFSVMTRRFVGAVLSCGEYNRFTKGLFGWVGYSTEWISYHNVERVAGETNWSFFSLLRYALDGIVAYSTKPLEVLSLLGGAISLLALVGLIFIVVRALLFGDPVAGWPSLMTVIVLIGGLLTLGLGVIGYYLSKLYLEVKKRPLYLEKERGGWLES